MTDEPKKIKIEKVEMTPETEALLIRDLDAHDAARHLQEYLRNAIHHAQILQAHVDSPGTLHALTTAFLSKSFPLYEILTTGKHD